MAPTDLSISRRQSQRSELGFTLLTSIIAFIRGFARCIGLFETSTLRQTSSPWTHIVKQFSYATLAKFYTNFFFTVMHYLISLTRFLTSIYLWKSCISQFLFSDAERMRLSTSSVCAGPHPHTVLLFPISGNSLFTVIVNHEFCVTLFPDEVYDARFCFRSIILSVLI